MALRHETLSGSVIGAFYAVYNALGHGFLESIYSAALELELKERGHQVQRELPVTVTYRGAPIGVQRLDLVVDGSLVVEVKATTMLHDSAKRQLYNYLHATHLEVGLLLHFGPEARFYRITHRHWQQQENRIERIRSDPSDPIPAV